MTAPKAKNGKPLPPFAWIAFFTIFLDLLGFGIIIPIQPFYAESLGASPATVTMLGATYSIMQFIFAPLWGRLSDRIGRRPIMLFSIVISAIGHLLFAYSSSLSFLFLARGLTGFGNANIGTAQAIVADITTAENRAKGMGLIGAAFGLGFIFGPVLGGMLGQYGPAAPALASAILAMINFIVAFLMLPETLPPAEAQRAQQANKHQRPFLLSIKVLREAAHTPNIAKIFAWLLIATSAFAMMEHVIGLFIERTWPADIATTTDFDRYKSAAAMTAYMLFVVGVVATIVQGGLIGRLTKRYGEIRLLRIGSILYVVSLGVLPIIGWLESFPLLLVDGGLMAVASGLANPSIMSLLSRSSDASKQGETLGIGQSLSSLGRVIGPASTGLLFQVDKNLPFIVGAALMVIAFMLSKLDAVDRGSPATNG